MNAPASPPACYSAAKEALIDIGCELMLLGREHEETKAKAKSAITDAYSNGEITAAHAVDLVREYGLEAA